MSEMTIIACLIIPHISGIGVTVSNHFQLSNNNDKGLVITDLMAIDYGLSGFLEIGS